VECRQVSTTSVAAAVLRHHHQQQKQQTTTPIDQTPYLTSDRPSVCCRASLSAVTEDYGSRVGGGAANVMACSDLTVSTSSI
jgi:hypothetical protein